MSNHEPKASAAEGASRAPAQAPTGGVRVRRTIGGDHPERPAIAAGRRRTLAAAAAALVLVGVVAALSGGLPGRVHGSAAGLSVSSLLADATAVLLALALGALCFLLYDAWVSRRPRRARRPRRRWRLRLPHLSWDPQVLLVALVVTALIALVLGLALLAGGRTTAAKLSLQRTSLPSAPPRAPVRAGSGGAVAVDGLAFAIAAAIVLLAGVVLAVRAHRRRQRQAPPGPADALALALDASLEDLDGEADPRRAVIKAYDRMERALAGSGTVRAGAETPLEFLRRALAAVHASQQSIRRLTDLFEQARFSRHAIDAGMKQEAIDALTALRSELDAGAPA